MSDRRDSKAAPPRPARRRGCLVLAVVAAILLGLSFLPAGPQHAVIRSQLARVLGDLTDREVRVGPVRRSLWRGLRIDGLSIAAEGGFGAGEPVVAVSEVGLRWSLFGLLVHLGDPLAAVSSIRIDGVEVQARREADGAWELVKLFKPKEPKPKKPFTFAGRLDLLRGSVRLIDETVAGPPITRLLDGLEAHLRFDGHGVATGEAELAAPELADHVQLSDARVQLEPLAVQGQLAVEQLRVGAVSVLANPLLRQWVRLERGTIESVAGTVSFQAAVKDGTQSAPADFGLDLTAQLHEVGVAVKVLGQPLANANGRLRVVLTSRADGGPGAADVIEADQLSATLGSSNFLVNGRLRDYRRTMLYDLEVDSRGWNVAESILLLPRLKVLQNLNDSGVSRFDLKLDGPLAALRVAGVVEPVNLRWADLAHLDGGRLTLDLRRVPRDDGLAGLLGGVELAGVDLGTKYLAQPLSGVLGTVRLGRDALGLQHVRARIDGAPLAIHGTVTKLLQAGRALDLTVETQGLSPGLVAPLLPARLRPSEVRGGLTARLRLKGPLKALNITGDARVPWFRTPAVTHLGGGYRLALQLGDRPTGTIGLTDAGVALPRLGGPVTAVNGTVRLQPGAAVLDDLRARWAGGPLRADGRLALGGGSHDLRLWTSGIDAAQVAGVLRRRDIRGRGWLALDLRLQGTPARLQVAGTAHLPWLRVPQVTVQQADLRLDLGIEPRRGLFGLNGVVTARQTAVKADRVGVPVAIDRGTFTFRSGTIRMAGVSGRANGDPFSVAGQVRFAGGRKVRVAELDLAVAGDRLRPATIRAAAGDLAVWKQVGLTAPVSARLRLSGPPDRLHIRGDVTVAGAELKQDEPLPLAADASLDLRLRPGTTPIGTIRVRSGSSVLTAFGLRVPSMAGLVTFQDDGRIALGEGESRPFAALVGGSRIGVSGTIDPGDELRLGLLVAAESVRMEDLRAVAGTLESPPEIEGDETIGGFRLLLSGPLSTLRIATVGPLGELAAPVPLPRRLAVAGYTIAGGHAGLDLTLGDGQVASGEVLLREVGLEVASTGTVGVVNGSVSLLDGRPAADLTALIDGRPLRVAGGTVADHEVAFRVRADDVPVLGLLPRQAAFGDAVETDRLSTDLILAGPLDDLAVAGTVALGGYETLSPAQAEVHLRLVQPWPETAEAKPGPRQVLGGVELTGGGLKLAALDEPLTDLSGSVDVALDTLQLHGVSAMMEGSRVRVDGSVDLLDEPLLDLRVGVPGLDLGRLLANLKRAPVSDPSGEPVPFLEALGLPLLRTPEPLSGELTVQGPLSQVAVGVDLRLPLVVVDAVDAMPPGPDPVFEPVDGGQVLLRDARITGSAVGSLASAAEAVPTGEELAGALNQLAGMTLVAMPAADEDTAAPAQPAALDSFVLGLTCRSEQLNPRQGFAFLSAEAQAGVLGEAYAYQPGRGSLEITGPLEDLRFRGEFDLARVVFQDVPLRRLAAKFDYFDHVMTLDQVLLDVRGGEVTGHGAMALRAKEPVDLAMELGISQVELAVLNRLKLLGDRALDLDGEVNGTVQLHLSEEVPKLQGALRLDGLQVVGESVGDGVVEFAVEKELLVLRRVELVEPAGRSHARVRGRVGLGEGGALDLLVDVRNLDLGRLAPLFSDPAKPAVTGRLDLVGAVTGNRRLPMVAGSGNIFFGSVAGMPFNRLSLRAVETGSDSLRLIGELSDAAYQATVTADLTDLDPEAGSLSYVLDADIDGVELAQALPQAGVNSDDSYGRVTGQAHFSGRMARQETESGETRLNPLLDLVGEADLAAGDPDRPGRLVVAGVVLDTAALKLSAARDRLVVEALDVHLGTTRIGIDPQRPNVIEDLSGEQRVELHLVSDELRVEDLVTLTRLPLQTDGALQVGVDVTGELRDPVADVRLRTMKFALNGEYIGDREVRATVSRQLAVIDGRQEFDLFGTRVVFAGSLDEHALDAQGDVEIHDLPRLREFLRSLTEPVGEQRRMAWQDNLRRQLEALPADLAGTITAQARLVGPKRRPSGYVQLAAKDLHAGEKPVPPVEVAVNLGVPNPREPARFEPGVLYVYGSASLGEDGSLRLQGRTDNFSLRPYGVWSEKLAGLRGELSLRAQATGTSEAPRFELQQLELAGLGLDEVALASCRVDSLVFRRGLLDLGRISVADGSLQASLTGFVPVSGLSFRPRRSSPMQLQFDASVERLAEFAELLGPVSAVDGSARAALTLGGTPAALTLDGGVEVDLPLLELSSPAEDHRPRHLAQLPGPLDELAAAAESVITPGEGRRRWLRLEQNAVRLAVADNSIRIEQFEFHSAPTDPAVPETAGSLLLLPGGHIDLPHPLDPSRLGQDGVLSQPIDLRLRVANVAGRTGTVSWSGLGAEVDIQPVFEGGVLNTVAVRNTGGWINGGLVALAGDVRQRTASLANWWDHDYALRFWTPAVAGDSESRSVPAEAASPVAVAGGVAYPLEVEQRGVGEAKALADIRLETRPGQTPPLTLAGDVEVFDTVVREGALALFAAQKKDQPAAAWPATPELDLTIIARRNNWIRAKVPELQVPVTGRVRLSQTPQQMKIEGNGQIGEGQLSTSFFKNRVAIRGGEAQFVVRRNRFSGAFEPFASLTAKAETTLTQAIGGGDVERFDVDLAMRGSARPGTDRPVETEFVVKATSNPPLAEERIFAMLSRKAEFASALESGELKDFLKQELANAALQTALSYALTPVFDELRQVLGLDVFTIRYELDRPLEIQASKYLLKRMLVTLFVEVGGAEGTKQTVKVDYEVAGGFRFGVQVDTDQEFRMTGEYSTRF